VVSLIKTRVAVDFRLLFPGGHLGENFLLIQTYVRCKEAADLETFSAKADFTPKRTFRFKRFCRLRLDNLNHVGNCIFRRDYGLHVDLRKKPLRVKKVFGRGH
jgi:hypothetical protein